MTDYLQIKLLKNDIFLSTMKINEQTLLLIAQSADNPTDLAGWLFLYNEEKKTFQKRWAILKENLFFYYESKSSKEPLGVIILEGDFQVEIVENVERIFTFKLDFGINQSGKELKSYIFATDSHEDMEKWVKSLSCSSYEYLVMVISELQHKLNEVKAFKRGIAMESNSKCRDVSSLLSNVGRVNPFDYEEVTTPKLTFYDLHRQYEKQVKPYLN